MKDGESLARRIVYDIEPILAYAQDGSVNAELIRLMTSVFLARNVLAWSLTT